MQETKIDPQDAIDAAKSLESSERVRCDWLTEWLPEDQMLAWAKDSLTSNNVRGNADAITWAKRAICARIDRFLNLCLLSGTASPKYPERIEILRKAGIELPAVVYAFVIKPRNDLEHLYHIPPDQAVARDAVEIAQLGLAATKSYLDTEYRCGCIALNWNVLYTAHYRQGKQESWDFQGFSNRPMVFVDVFDTPVKVKVIDPINKETRFVPLDAFDTSQILLLCTLMNQWPSNTRTRNESQYSPEFIKAAKQKLGF
jgi:hypothetical protein